MDNDLLKKLFADFPAEAWVDTGSGAKQLSPAYMVERLNETFGLDGWTLAAEVVDAGRLLVKGTLKIKNPAIERTAFGVGDVSEGMDALNGAMMRSIASAAVQLGLGLDELKRAKGPSSAANQAQDFRRNIRTRPPVREQTRPSRPSGQPITPIGPSTGRPGPQASFAPPSPRLLS